MPKQSLNPNSLFNSLQYGFSQITIGEGSKIVTISGQVGWDENKSIDNDFRSQTMKAFENVRAAITEAGGTMNDIIFLHIYIVESAMPGNVAVKDGLKAFFPESPPATSWVGVPCLANDDFLIEIETMAVIA